jgi:hypothetical protein
MLVKDYIQFLSDNKQILDLTINYIYKGASYKDVLTRLYNQLIFFDNIQLMNCKVADIGSGIGIHANYFYNKGADVTCFDIDPVVSSINQQYFPNLRVINSTFNFDKTYDIICLYGIVPFVEETFIINLFSKAKILIIDSTILYSTTLSRSFAKTYYDRISKKNRVFSLYINS